MKYLQQRNGIWYLRVAKPPRVWGFSGEFVHTLRTSNLSEARKIRDKYLLPILAETKGIEAAQTILRSICNNDETIKNKLLNLGEILGDDNSTPSVSEIFNKFIDYKHNIKQKSSTIDAYQACINSYKMLMPHNIPIDQITPKHIIEWRDKLLKLPPGWMNMKVVDSSSKRRMSPTTINNQIIRFRTVWDWAQKENYILGKLTNPARNISAGKSSKSKTNRPISVDECNMLMQLPHPTRIESISKKSWTYIPIIARYTGARFAEIAQLTTDDIKIIQGGLCIQITDYNEKTTKNKQSIRTIPISEKLKDSIEPLIEESNNSKACKELFKKRGDHKGRIGKYFSSRWNLLAKEIGSHCYFHGLRAYAITQMANAGIPELDRMRIAGHKSNSSHSGYTKDDYKRLKKAVDTIN